MATAPLPLTNIGSGYTIVTQVIPSSTDHQNFNPNLSPLRVFLKGEPKALGSDEGSIMIFLLFSLLQFTVSISIAIFACKAVCSKHPAIQMVPYPGGGFPVDNIFPGHPGFSSVNTFTMSSSPVESPPAYSETRDPEGN
ncbi:hypothetical protein Baya_15366 [Bagarius yarrelli]|uniref:Uncharacterized protein n=1 Tax=Bagarius yarrelli TaxID=175774 RepID=A0A556VC65_BAGYA|nr:hypothetical protein Baya_15366 [Bagarius yarrelli]